MSYTPVIIVFFVLGGSYASVKRGVVFDTFPHEFATFDDFSYSKPVLAPKPYVPSSGEIASAIQAAKEASSNVMAAQHRVHQAKEDVINQQNLANQKQTQAALALQKTEAAAAVQQQEAKSAANALIQAQQRLAQAKSEVSELQKIASVKEAHAAAVIGKSAAAAAAEVHRSGELLTFEGLNDRRFIDEATRKLSALQSSNAAALQQVAAAKDGSLTATSAAVEAAAERNTGGGHVTWVPGPKFVQFNPWG